MSPGGFVAMHRFLAPRGALMHGTVTLGPRESHHAAVVLRLREGDVVELLDGHGAVASARLSRVGRDGVEAVVSSLDQREPPRVAVGLVAALIKGKAWDWTLQKCTEAGVSCIVPVLARRSVVRIDPEEAARRRGEWERTVEEAAKQCGVAWLPEVTPPVSLESWLRPVAADEAGWIAALDGDRRSLLGAAREVGPGVRRAWVAVGPEGDWDADEVARFRHAGFRGVTLGGNVMRAETAALAAVVLARAAFDAG